MTLREFSSSLRANPLFWKQILPENVLSYDTTFRSWFINYFNCSKSSYVHFMNRTLKMNESFMCWYSADKQKTLRMSSKLRVFRENQRNNDDYWKKVFPEDVLSYNRKLHSWALSYFDCTENQYSYLLSLLKESRSFALWFRGSELNSFLAFQRSQEDYWKSVFPDEVKEGKLPLKQWFITNFSCSDSFYQDILIQLHKSQSFNDWYNQRLQKSLSRGISYNNKLYSFIDNQRKDEDFWKTCFPDDVLSYKYPLKQWFIKHFGCSEYSYADCLNRVLIRSKSFSKWLKRPEPISKDRILQILDSAGIIPIDIPDNASSLYEHKGKCKTCGEIFSYHFLRGHAIPTVCPNCNKDSTSLEREIANYLKSKGLKVTLHLRLPFINFKELDIFIDDMNIAFEINGAFSHNSGFNVFGALPKDRLYHQFKTKQCEKFGIRLYHLWEHWDIDKIKDILDSKLGLNQKKLYARKLEVIFDTNSSRVNDLFDSSHVLNHTKATFTVALADSDGILFQAIQFKLKGNKTLDLVRNVTRTGYSVIGGTFRLFKHALLFIHLNYPEINCIVTYAIRDLTPFSSDSVYSRLGFKCLGDSGPTLSYYAYKNLKDSFGNIVFQKGVYSRDTFMKYKLNDYSGKLITSGGSLFVFDASLTEQENLAKLSVYPVYNSGCWKFEYKL